MFSDLPLHAQLQKAISKLAFEKPTPVQEQTIPLALEGKDLLVSAKTGSGKTAAFLLPALHKFLENPAPDSGTRALILVPTRELARQVMKQCGQLARFTGIKVGLVIGGEDFKYQKAVFRKNPEFLVATPGRLVEHLESGSIRFKDLELLVLDEADRMLDMGFIDDVLFIASHCNDERQTLMFSATLKQHRLPEVIEKTLKSPQSLIIDKPREKHSQIRQQVILADDAPHKDKLTAWLLENETFDKALIFCNTRTTTTRLCGLIRYKKQRAGALQGDMDQSERNHIMTLFRDGQINVLIATDIAARGLDVEGIDLVINYDMARNGDDYIHRIGRTGRVEEQGLAISLINSYEWNLKASIERYLHQSFERRLIKELAGKYKGPKKIKTSGKAAASKKKKAAKKADEDRPKRRLRDQKNIGKRRKPRAEGAASNGQAVETGFEPLKKRT